MAVYTIDALEDQRWDELTLRHPRAGIFHSRPWLQVLRQTYGYRPVVLTTTEPGRPLANGVVFCEVNSWFTGRRLVSLPFSDHCALLTNSTAEEAEIFAQLRRQVVSDRWRYAEIRPEEEMPEGALEDWQSGPKFSLHVLPLDMPLEKLFSNLHKDCIQRKIRRAERENLAYEYGRSDALLRKFFGLLLRTRRRHGLPPQPFRWFQNLAEIMGDSLKIRVALKNQLPVAAILTLSGQKTITYKYGCSDERYNQLGGMPFLFWKVIQEAWQEGMQQLDLGRSEVDNSGLIKFKDRLGAQSRTLTCWQWHPRSNAQANRPLWLTHAGKQVFRRLPDTLLVATGKFLYRHIA